MEVHTQVTRRLALAPGIAIFAAVLVASSGTAVWLAQLPSVLASKEVSSLAQFAVVAVSLVATVLLVTWVAPGFATSAFLTPRVGKSQLFAWCVLSIVAGGGCGYLGLSLGSGMSSLRWPQMGRGFWWLVSVGMNIVLTPAFEEMLFRGVLFSALRERLSFFLAALLSALAFGVVHFAPPAEGAAFVGAALWFAYAFEVTRSLLPCVIGHAAMNCMYGLA